MSICVETPNNRVINVDVEKVDEYKDQQTVLEHRAQV